MLVGYLLSASENQRSNMMGKQVTADVIADTGISRMHKNLFVQEFAATFL